ncbi:hypothetical protein SD074_03920 [Prolixibacter sp. SD074]|nr:hypothetical protein SD074_03920 [Prolixibacter sp. SD074]
MIKCLKDTGFRWPVKPPNASEVKFNNVHIAGRGSVVRQLRILASQFRVLRTGTLSEIRPDNMYQPLCFMLRKDPASKKTLTELFDLCNEFVTFVS